LYTGAHTEAEKERMAIGGLVTEVEVLSLTNAQLVLDLHRLRNDLSSSNELAQTALNKCERMQRELDEVLPVKKALELKLEALEERAKGLELDLRQRKHLKTPAGKWVAISMQASRRDLDDQLELRRKEFEEWMADRREELEREMRAKEQYLADRIDEKERQIVDLHQKLRTEIELKENALTEIADLQSTRRLFEEKCESEVSNAKTELDLANRTIKDLEAQVAADAEEYRRGLATLQQDLEMSSETLRAALREAKSQLAAAHARLQKAHLQLAEKNAILDKSELQILELQNQLQEANNTFLIQSMETGCMACRKARLAGPAMLPSPRRT
jgi:chromosome segregation ATPase